MRRLPTDEAWKSEGLCNLYKDSVLMASLFFGVTKEAQAAAKIICLTPCPVRLQCLAYALDNREPDGVWGGLRAEERRLLIKDRKANP